MRTNLRATAMRCLIIGCLFFITGGDVPAKSEDATSHSVKCRIGIVCNSGSDEFVAGCEKAFTELADKSLEEKQPIQFHYTFGTYSEIRSWYDSGELDAIVCNSITAGMFLDKRDELDGHRKTSEFIATVAVKIKPTNTEFANTYNSVAISPKWAGIDSLEELHNRISDSSVTLSLGSPLSASSYLVPIARIRDSESLGDWRPESSSVMGDHKAAIQHVITVEKTDGPAPVAFTYHYHEDVVKNAAQLNVIDLEPEIPQDALICRPGELAQRLSQLVKMIADDQSTAAWIWVGDSQDMAGLYDELYRNVKDVMPVEAETIGESGMSIARVLSDFRYVKKAMDANSFPQVPKLAIVLAGGGAKCAYQAGVLDELEKELNKQNAVNEDEAFDVSLIIGTSGGAINALPVAMKQTAKLPELWNQVGRHDLLQLNHGVEALVGVIFALMLYSTIRTLDFNRRHWWRWLATILLCGWSLHLLFAGSWLALFERVVTDESEFVAISILGRSRIWFWAAGAILALTLIAHFPSRNRQRAKLPVDDAARKRSTWRQSAIDMAVIAMVAGAILLQCYYVTSLFDDADIEQVIVGQINSLRDENGGNPDALAINSFISEELAKSDRDLVITLTSLGTASEKPTELFFHTFDEEELNGIPKFKELAENVRQFDKTYTRVIGGSGSLFPIFPPVEVPDKNGNPTLVVDGGFAHNAPIRAAVNCGASHVVVIQPTPEANTGLGDERGLLANIGGSINLLFEMSQRTDRVGPDSNLGARVYSIWPKGYEEEWVGLLDFVPERAKFAIETGRQNATSNSFVKSLGSPIYKTIVPSAKPQE